MVDVAVVGARGYLGRELMRWLLLHPEVDSLVRLQRAGCRIAERSVRMRPRGGGQSSIDAFGAVYYMLKVTIALLMGRVERAEALDSGVGRP